MGYIGVTGSLYNYNDNEKENGNYFRELNGPLHSARSQDLALTGLGWSEVGGSANITSTQGHFAINKVQHMSYSLNSFQWGFDKALYRGLL